MGTRRSCCQRNRGAYITVTDEAIIKGISQLGKVGIFAEPAGSTAYAGLQKAIEMSLISENDPVVV
jgi:threonine synthase